MQPFKECINTPFAWLRCLNSIVDMMQNEDKSTKYVKRSPDQNDRASYNTEVKSSTRTSRLDDVKEKINYVYTNQISTICGEYGWSITPSIISPAGTYVLSHDSMKASDTPLYIASGHELNLGSCVIILSAVDQANNTRKEARLKLIERWQPR